MTMKECYLALGGDYENILSRFRSEERVQKYVLKFLEDPSFCTLQNALERGCNEEAFRAAHTLKGLAQNLSFKRLAESSHQITEALRNQNIEETMSLFVQVQEDYQVTIKSIETYQNNIA